MEENRMYNDLIFNNFEYYVAYKVMTGGLGITLSITNLTVVE